MRPNFATLKEGPRMKTIALIAAIMVSTTFALEPATASAGSTSRWIQLGLSAANTAHTAAKARQGGGLLSKAALNPQPLPPKLFRRR